MRLRFIVALFVGILVVNMVPAFAEEISQQVLEGDIGITPDSPFYGFKRFAENLQLWFTFNKLEKAKLRYRLAQIRLAEAERMAELNKTELAEKTLGEYESMLDEVNNDVQRLSASGVNVSSVAEIVNNATYKHILVLSSIRDKLPEKAKVKIETVIKRSMERQKEIVARFSKKRLVNVTISFGNKTITERVPLIFAKRFLEKARELKKIHRRVEIENREDIEEEVANVTANFREKAKEEIEDVKEELAEAKEKNIGNITLLDRAEKYLQRAETAFKQGNYRLSFNSAIKAARTLRLLDKISEGRFDVEHLAEKIGISPENIKQRLVEVKEKLSEAKKKIDDAAVNCSQQTSAEVSAENLGAEVASETRKCQYIRTAKRLLKNVEEHITKAEVAFDNGRYGRAFGHVVAAERLIATALGYVNWHVYYRHGQCPSSPPQVCAAVYSPVCAEVHHLRDDGTYEIRRKTFPNACKACASSAEADVVVGYTRGPCKPEIKIPEKPTEVIGGCAQVITPAVSPEGECKKFPTPCDVPEGWKKVEECPATSPNSTELTSQGQTAVGEEISKVSHGLNE